MALTYFAHNFIKIHRTLRMTPAMAAGVTDRLWSVEDLVALWEAYEERRAERAAQLMRKLTVGKKLYLWDERLPRGDERLPRAYRVTRIDVAAYLLEDDHGEEKVISHCHEDLSDPTLVALAGLHWGF